MPSGSSDKWEDYTAQVRTRLSELTQAETSTLTIVEVGTEQGDLYLQLSGHLTNHIGEITAFLMWLSIDLPDLQSEVHTWGDEWGDFATYFSLDGMVFWYRFVPSVTERAVSNKSITDWQADRNFALTHRV